MPISHCCEDLQWRLRGLSAIVCLSAQSLKLLPKLSAETDEVKAEGWRQKDLRIVLAAQKQERDLWGLDEPARTQLTGAEGDDIVVRILGNIDPEKL